MRDLVGAVILLGVVQGAILAPALWLRRANQLANRILATLVAAVALMLLLGHVERRWAFDGHPHLLALSAPLPFLFGPLLYLYVVALTRPLVRFEPRWLMHGLPFAAHILYMAQSFYVKGGAEKLALARASIAGSAPLSFHAVNVLEAVQALVYVALGWFALARYGRKVHGYFSDLARIDLRWLRALVLSHAGVWILVLAVALLRATAHTWSRAISPLVQLGAAFGMFLTGYVSLWQTELVQKASAANVAEEAPASEPPPTEPPPPEPPAPQIAPPKYQRNRLDEAEAQELVDKLEALMKEKQLYRDSSLTLPVLADALGVSPHTLSQILNVRLGKSFFVYVNAYRADALKVALADPSRARRGVLELGLEVGFSSKSTLNSFFKKHTGMTPTEFRSRVQGTKMAENQPL